MAGLPLTGPVLAQTLSPDGAAGGASSGAAYTGGGGGGGGGAGLQLTTSNSLTTTVTGAAGGAGGGENASGSAGGSGSGTTGGTGGPGGGTDGGTGGNGGGGAFGGAGTAGSGGDPGLGGGGGGGAALVINGASLIVSTSGAVTGGAGGAGGGANSSFAGNLGNGGTGGAGIASASTGLQVSNSGTITGGAGGDAGFLGFLGNGATNGVGGAGGAGVSLSGDSASFTNTGTVRGGTGGLLNTLNSYTGSGAGGDGGAGLVISGASGTVSNSGTIRGATGGYDIDSNVSQGGASGAGVILSGSGTSLANGTVLTNNAGGTIVGANRDVLFAVSGPDNGGAGVSISGNYNSLNNAGTITGGSAGTAGTAGVLVTGDNNLVISSGTITGGGSGGTVAPSVQFDGNNNTLELRAGYVLSGGAKVNGTGGTLVLGGTTNATFDLSRLGTSATSFNGFSAFTKTGTSTWTLNNIYTGTSNWSIQQGTLAMSSLAEVTGTASVASGAALSVLAFSRIHGQVTIANGGTLVTTTTTGAAALDGLTLSPTSILEMNVTRAGNGTGLLTLGSGGLVLDGTLNIINSSNALTAGTYRLFNVIGTLTNNTMVIGSAPIQYSYAIDLSDPVFINLLVEANVGYWNGAQTTQNGIVNGGTGTWDASTTNWTNATGTIAKVWGGYEAYFQGTPGTVTLDNAGVSAYLMHFGVDGYTLSGGSLTLLSLSAAKPIIEVTTGTATIQSVIAGTAGLDKTGAGTLVLSGANTYTGNTNITAGTLQIDGAGSILGSVANSGALVFSPSSDLTFAGAITGTGSLTKQGTSRLTLSGVNTYSGSTTISAGTLQMDVGSNAALSGTIANAGALIINTNTVGLDGLNLNGVISGTGTLTKNGAGSLKLFADNTYTGVTTVTAGVLYVGFGTTTGTILGDIVNNAPVIVGGVNSGQGVAFFRSNSSTYSGVMSGTGQMGVGGGGSLTLTGENTYTGNTFITGNATLIIGDGTTHGSLIGDIQTTYPPMPSAGPGTVAFNRSDLVTFPGSISGPGGLEQRGSGTLVLSGNNNVYTGATVITQGTLQVGDGTSGSIPAATSVANSGVLAFNLPADFAFSGAISGTGAVTKLGANTLSLSGANTYSGITTISGGTLRVTGTGTLGSGNIVNNSVLEANTTGTLSISGVISGTGSLVQSGAGGMILTGNNTFTGGTTISAGGIDVGSVGGGAAGTTTGDIGNVNITNASSFLAFYRSNAYTYGGVISGVGQVNKGGDGTTTFTGENTYTGGTQVSRGTLQIGNGGTAGWIAGDVQILSGANLTFNRSDDKTFGGAIIGAGSLTKLGGGELTLTGTNTYTGGTTISVGTLVVGDGATSGAIAGNIVNNATLAFNRSDAVTFAGDISGTGTINKLNTNTLTLTGNASAFSGTTNVQAGTLALSTSAYGGSVDVLNGATLTGAGNVTGTVSVQNGGTIVVPTGGTTSYGTLALNQTSHLALTLPSSANSSPFYSVGNLTLDGVLDIASSGSYGYGTYRLMDYVGSLTDNTLDVGPSSPWQYTFSVVVDTATQQVNLLVDGNTGYWNGTSAPPSGTIRGGDGTWTGDPATFNWTDRFGSVAENWLSYKAVFAGTPGTVTIDNTYAPVQTAGMQFAVSGYMLTGGDLLLSNTINPQGQIPIQVGDGTPAGASMTATIATVLTGTQGMTKTDLGTLILTANNTYTGGTTIAAGTLQLGDGGTTGAILGDVMNNGKLVFNRSDAITFAGNISGTGELQKLGGASLTLSGTNTYSGATNVAAGTLVLSGGAAIGDLSAVTVAAGASLISSAAETIGSLAGAGNVTINSFPLTMGGDNSSTTFSGVVSGTAGLIKAGTGTLTLSGVNTNTGGTSVSAGRLIVSSGSALSDAATVFVNTGATLELVNANESVGAIANGGAIVLNANTLTVGGGDGGGTFSGSISGSGGLIKIGAGQQSLTGTNTFSGPLQISAGTLVVQNGAAINDQSAVTVDSGAIFGLLSSETIGSLAGAGNVTTITTTTLTTGGNNASTLFSGVINELAGALSLVKTGTGTLTLTGANTYVGGTTISGGTLQIGNGGTTGSIVGDVTNNGALAFSRSDAVTYANVVSGTGSLTQSGSGVLTLTGANTYTGGTTVSAGTLQIGNGGTTGWLAGAIANSGTVVFNRSDNVTAPGAVTGTGALVQRGAGRLTLAGANSAGAGTTVEAGTLEILSGVSLASNIVVQSGATLKGETSGTAAAAINGAVSVLNGGTLLAAPTTTAGTYGLSMTSLTLADTAILSVVLGSNTGNAVFSAGTLALDGVLDVTNAGAMSLGVYRILDYGTLASDGGLRLGTTPLAFAYEIQQLAGQVNLAVLNGDILYWNGSQTTPDGTVHGGTGTWAGSAGATNWTTSPANQSRAWNNSFAVFGGTAGAVTIDGTTSGAVSATGVQFMVTGYTVGGDTLTLAAPSGQTQVRVGDGTPSGATYVATVSSVIAGSTGLEKTDLGTLILTGANSYTGGTTITQGTLQLGDGGTSGSILGDVVNNGILAFNRADNVAFAGAISGTGSLTKAGGGTLTLTGTNSFSGATSVTAGRLIIGGGSSLSDTAGVAIAAGGALELMDSNETVGGLSGAGDVALNSYCLTVAGGGAYSGAISGAGCLVKSGTGTLTLSGTSTYSGGTTVSAGTVQVTSAANLGTGSLALEGPGVLRASETFTYASAISLTPTGGVGGGTFEVDDTKTLTLTGAIAGLGALDKTGTGTLVLGGTGTYSGATNVNTGTVIATGGQAVGDTSAVTVAAGAQFILQGNETVGSIAGGGALTLDGASLTTGGTNATTTYSGAIGGSGGLTKTGTGTLTLTGTNTYSGATAISGGQVVIGGGSSLSDTAGLTIAAGAGLQLTDANETIGSLAGAGSVALGGNCLSTGGDNSSTSFSGSISGSGCVTKTGTGTLELTGTNTYDGTTTVSGGAVQVTTAAALGTGSLALEGPGALRASETFTYASAVSLTPVGGVGGGTFDVDPTKTLTLSNVVSGTGALTKSGTGTLVMTGANTYTGATTVGGGQLVIGGGASLSDTAGLTVAAGAGLQLTDASETIGSLAGGGSVALGGNCLTTGGDNSSTTFSGSISGAGCVTKTGTGTLALTGTSTYSGTTTVSGGAVQVTSAGALGTGALALEGPGTLRASATFTSASAISLTPVGGVGGGTVEVDATQTLTLTGIIAGLGALDKTGAGTLVIGGANTYSGATSVTAGILIATGGQAISDTGTVAVASGAQFILQGNETVGAITGAGVLTLDGASLTTGGDNTSTTYAGAIGGTGGLTKTGTGVLTLSGASTYTGDTQVAAGGLSVAGSLSGDVYVQNLATLSGGGSIGGTVHVLDGGTLSGTQLSGLTMGGLDLASAATLNVALGAPSAGTTFTVNGNVTLDGTLTVTATPGFGLGIYRIINYTGTLTDNGITVGSLPGGLEGGVQSSVPNQVNLFVEDPNSPILFWNGTNTVATQTVKGGSGTWTADAQTNWINASATIPKSWNSGFAVFQGTAGTVTVDNTAAQVATVGMQFVETGYVVTGGAIELTGTSASIRVGDGTQAGAGTVATIASALIGTAGLEKSDFGTLILTGSNTYTGGTTVSGGTLQIGDGGTSGAILGNITTNAALAFNRSDDISVSGAISGTGSLTQLGTGTLNLTGANSYSGGTSIQAGTLQVSGASALGTGGLALSGSAVLRASASFTSGDAVSLTAVGGSGGGTFNVDASQTLTLSGAIAGTGGLTKSGDGLLILTGAGSYSGLTTISAGTLQIGNGGTTGSIAGDVVNNASLVFDRSDTYTFTGAITGSGAVTFTGGGTVLFSSPYTGPVAVNNSMVQLQAGSVTTSPFTVNAGGVLGGTATIGGLTVNSGGTAAPGYSPGTLTVTGAVTFNAGSIYAVDVTPAGAHDLIIATGAVTLSSGASVQVLAVPGKYDPTSSYAIITTSGTVTGTFGSVSSDYAFLSPQLSYDAQNVYLTLTYTGADFIDFATTSNEAGVAVAAQALGSGNAIFDALLSLPNPAVAPAFNQLSGEAYASAYTVIQQQSIYLRDAVGTRLRQSAAGTSTDALSYAAKAAGPATALLSQELTPTLWMQGYGGWGSSFGNTNAASISNTIGGFFGGVDVSVTDAVRVGLVAGFSQSSFDVNARTSSGSSDNYDIALYAGGQFGALALRGGLAYAWHDMSVSRTVTFPGYSGSNGAGYSLGTAQVFGEVGYDVTVGAYAFEPFAGLAYVNVSGGSFTESGSIASALSVDGATQNTLYSTLGLRAATSLQFGGHTFSPSLTVGWQHAFGDTTPAANMLFSGGATPFQIQGVPIAEDAVLLGAGLAYQFSDAAALQLNYTGQIASQTSQNAFNAQFSLKF